MFQNPTLVKSKIKITIIQCDIAQKNRMDDFHFLTLQGREFEKSKFNIKLSKKIYNLKFVFVSQKHDYFCLYLSNKGPTYQFSKKKSTPSSRVEFGFN